jgi:hypothetical protein
MRDVRRLALFLGTLAAHCAVSSHARAAEPSAAECAAANEKSAELQKAGKLLEARAELATCGAASCPADVHDTCTKRGAELSSAVPTVTLDVKGGAGSDLAHVAVTLDGQPLPTGLDKIAGVEIELDPGDHVFTFRAPGQPPSEKRFTLRDGEKRRESVDLGSLAPPPPPTTDAAPQTAAGTVVQFYSPSDRWADGRWSLVDKDHLLVCNFPCAHPVPQDSGLAIRRIPTQYGHEDEFYALPKTFDVPQGQSGRITVSKARLWGTYGRYGSIFPILLGTTAGVVGLYFAGAATSLSTGPPGTTPLFTKGDADAIAVSMTALGVILLGGGVTWLILARDPQVSIVPEDSPPPKPTSRAFAPPFGLSF